MRHVSFWDSSDWCVLLHLVGNAGLVEYHALLLKRYRGPKYSYSGSLVLPRSQTLSNFGPKSRPYLKPLTEFCFQLELVQRIFHHFGITIPVHRSFLSDQNSSTRGQHLMFPFGKTNEKVFLRYAPNAGRQSGYLYVVRLCYQLVRDCIQSSMSKIKGNRWSFSSDPPPPKKETRETLMLAVPSSLNIIC